MQIIEASEESLYQAIRSHRITRALRLMAATVAIALVLVGLFFVNGQIPMPAQLRPVALLPANQLFLSGRNSAAIATENLPAPRTDIASTEPLPRVNLLVEPWRMEPRETFTMTVFLHSSFAQPLDSVRLDLDLQGPTGFYHFALAVKGPLPAHGVSILRLTPELLASPCQEQYLMSPTELFAVPGVYNVRLTLFDPVVASR
jgi:hypothetical protein